ncbi:hypothetical protein P261_02901 [Lachnospiraceae bacterium TWA4]|nr:hypothetical protein P261_02901 [Lachnospiraceae bacterium TWA4]
MKLIYYELLKILKSKTICLTFFLLIVMNVIGIFYTVYHLNDDDFSILESVKILSDSKEINENIDNYIREKIIIKEEERLEKLSKYEEYLSNIYKASESIEQSDLFGQSNSFTKKLAKKQKLFMKILPFVNYRQICLMELI